MNFSLSGLSRYLNQLADVCITAKNLMFEKSVALGTCVKKIQRTKFNGSMCAGAHFTLDETAQCATITACMHAHNKFMTLSVHICCICDTISQTKVVSIHRVQIMQ